MRGSGGGGGGGGGHVVVGPRRIFSSEIVLAKENPPIRAIRVLRGGDGRPPPLRRNPSRPPKALADTRYYYNNMYAMCVRVLYRRSLRHTTCCLFSTAKIFHRNAINNHHSYFGVEISARSGI